MNSVKSILNYKDLKVYLPGENGSTNFKVKDNFKDSENSLDLFRNWQLDIESICKDTCRIKIAICSYFNSLELIKKYRLSYLEYPLSSGTDIIVPMTREFNFYFNILESRYVEPSSNIKKFIRLINAHPDSSRIINY